MMESNRMTKAGLDRAATTIQSGQRSSIVPDPAQTEEEMGLYLFKP